MSARFGEAARRLAGQANALLGWSPDSFWNATPDELACALEALCPAAEQPIDAAAFARLREMHPDG